MTLNKHNQLPRHPNLWMAKDMTLHNSLGISTGYDNLDSVLSNSGWPSSGLIEIQHQQVGNGELRLIAPVLKQLSQSRSQWITWVNTPLIPYAPGLQSLGIDTQKILLIHTKTHQDTLWALEKSCKSNNCSAVLGWVNRPVKFKETQRLQLAAKTGGNIVFLFYLSHSNSASSSASEIRLLLKSTEEPGVISVDICKKRGGWPVSNIKLSVSQTIDTSTTQTQDIKEKLHLWRGTRTASAGNYNSVQDEVFSNNAPQKNQKGLIQVSNLQ